MSQISQILSNFSKTKPSITTFSTMAISSLNKNVTPIRYESNYVSFKMKNFEHTLLDDYKKKELFDKPKQSKCYYDTQTILINIRGHIRDAFNSQRLYNFLKTISNYFIVKIYIHTWNKKANNISWREYQENNEIITETMIRNYFNDLSITSICIQNDTDIELVGNTSGKLFSSKMPKIGWKNMWYGMYKSMNEIYKNENDRTIILNTRFDVFTNSNKVTETQLLKWLDSTLLEINYQKINKNYFLREKQISGVDNQILGDKNTLYKLMYHFQNNLDDIEPMYSQITCHEASVYYENIRIQNMSIEDFYKIDIVV